MDYMRSITEKMIVNLSPALVNFLWNAMKYSFCTTEKVAIGLANSILYLKEIDPISMQLFLKEIVDNDL